jgi:hypothetical protein
VDPPSKGVAVRLARMVVLIAVGLALASSADAQKPDSSQSSATKSKVLEPGTGKGSSHKGGRYMTLPPGSSIRPPALKVPLPNGGASAPPSGSAPTATESVKRNGKGKIARSEEARRAFEKQTGYPNGRNGYVIDHIVPLACGGTDKPSNMQWQTTAEAKAKDKVERKGCGRP